MSNDFTVTGEALEEILPQLLEPNLPYAGCGRQFIIETAHYYATFSAINAPSLVPLHVQWTIPDLEISPSDLEAAIQKAQMDLWEREHPGERDTVEFLLTCRTSRAKDDTDE